MVSVTLYETSVITSCPKKCLEILLCSRSFILLDSQWRSQGGLGGSSTSFLKKKKEEDSYA